MRFYQGCEIDIPVDWYFVPESRGVVPFAHSFGSRIYERADELPDAVGERFKPVTWRGGQPPAPEPNGEVCGAEEQWQNGTTLKVCPVCGCPVVPVRCSCAGQGIGTAGGIGYGSRNMPGFPVTFDLYRPWGSPFPLYTGIAGAFEERFTEGRGFFPQNCPSYTDLVTVDFAIDILDGCTRTPPLNTINYADGDELRFSCEPGTRFVVVWVAWGETDGVATKRAYLMRDD